jgi:hypothetical protein
VATEAAATVREAEERAARAAAATAVAAVFDSLKGC